MLEAAGSPEARAWEHAAIPGQERGRGSSGSTNRALMRGNTPHTERGDDSELPGPTCPRTQHGRAGREGRPSPPTGVQQASSGRAVSG